MWRAAASLCFDVLESGKQLQASPKAASAQVLLELIPKVVLKVVPLAQPLKAFLVDLIKVIVEHPERLATVDRSGAFDDAERLLDPSHIQQPTGAVRGDGSAGQLLFRAAGNVGVDIALCVRNIDQDDRPGGLLWAEAVWRLRFPESAENVFLASALAADGSGEHLAFPPA